MKIGFHYDIEGFRLRETGKIKRVIRKIITDAGKKPGSAEVIFTNDEKLLEINREFLSHDYLTDIITFDYCGIGLKILFWINFSYNQANSNPQNYANF